MADSRDDEMFDEEPTGDWLDEDLEDVDELEEDLEEDLDEDLDIDEDADEDEDYEGEDRDEDEEGEEDEAALDDLEAEELEMLTEDEAAESLPVDEAEELRQIRREAIALESGAEEINDDEFVCSNCFQIKRISQLANKKRRLCRDCA